MAEVLEPPRWQTVGAMIDQNQRDFLAHCQSLSEDVLAWFKATDAFRAIQDDRMILQKPTAGDLRQHRTWVASLIAEGERLVTEVLARSSPTDNREEFQVADVEATLELLYLWQREWHGPKMSAAKRQNILKDIFNGQEPST